MNFAAHSTGMALLRHWWRIHPLFPTGESGFQNALKNYSFDQVMSFGQMALNGSLTDDQLKSIAVKAVSEYGSKVPPRSAWNTYLMNAGSSVSVSKVVKQGLVSTGEGILSAAKWTGISALTIGVIGGAVYLMVRYGKK